MAMGSWGQRGTVEVGSSRVLDGQRGRDGEENRWVVEFEAYLAFINVGRFQPPRFSSRDCGDTAMPVTLGIRHNYHSVSVVVTLNGR